MSLDTMRDVMQVCLSGHVITDVLGSHPDQGVSHCDRCGAPTTSHCQTCGAALPGATLEPGPMPIGRRTPPAYCPCCGAALPWTRQPPVVAAADTRGVLAAVLRRLPHAVRQLRDRHAGRPTLRVEDDHDLADLLRVILHLHFDDVRRESRTPSYATAVRTDFLVGPERIAVTAKLVGASLPETALAQQIGEDAAYYRRVADCGGLVVLLYDPEQVLRDPRQTETTLRRQMDVHGDCIVAS